MFYSPQVPNIFSGGSSPGTGGTQQRGGLREGDWIEANDFPFGDGDDGLTKNKVKNAINFFFSQQRANALNLLGSGFLI